MYTNCIHIGYFENFLYFWIIVTQKLINIMVICVHIDVDRSDGSLLVKIMGRISCKQVFFFSY